MNKDNVISLGLGLLITSFVSGFVYYFLFLATFDMFGTQSIVDPEQRHGTIFYVTLSITFANFIAMIVLRFRKMKYASWGTILFIAIGTFILFVVGPTYFKKSNYYEQFDKSAWKKSENRIKMARQLIKSKELIGLTKEELKERLGEGRAGLSSRQPTMFFPVMGDYCRLVLTVHNNKVTDSFLWVDN